MTYEPSFEYPPADGYDAGIDGDSERAPLMSDAWKAMLASLSAVALTPHADLIAAGVSSGIAESTARQIISRAMERHILRARIVDRRGYNLYWAYTTAPGGERTQADTREWHVRRQASVRRSRERQATQNDRARALAEGMSVND